ncbi:hypothetical protein ES288_A11G195700v1 [Gossypium darwinii]|uniref:Uncharacterized protein n=1 Tax=Gossypium darwinii TaxID=34276 RepID=A0A5D2ELH4_GOSDA|nr:hypothetical protein ES288_A11G195700v1 [Gossypium darwinii]
MLLPQTIPLDSISPPGCHLTTLLHSLPTRILPLHPCQSLQLDTVNSLDLSFQNPIRSDDNNFQRIKLYLPSSFEIISLKLSFSLDFLAIFSPKRSYVDSALLPSVHNKIKEY